MPRPLKPRKRGKPRQEAKPDPELIGALSLAGVPRERIAQLVGLSLATLDRRYRGHLKAGPKLPVQRVAGLVQRLVALAEGAATPQDIGPVLAVVRLLAPLHLPELAKSWSKEDAAPDLPPVQPEQGHEEPGDG